MLRRLQFDLWYLWRPPWDSGVSPPELLNYIRAHPPGRAIDLGCGSGTNVLTLSEHGWHVTGVDFSPRAIRRARNRMRRAGADASLCVADVTRLAGIPGPFDLALDIGCFHAISNRSAYLDHLCTILAPGGSWLLYGFLGSGIGNVLAGLDSSDLDLIESRGFRLLDRQDGLDGRGRPSAWFQFASPT